jgi:branched-chain amino acid transport system permease protein
VTEFSVIWEGFVSGALYGLLGLGYLITLRATRSFNFSIGAFTGFSAVAFASWGDQLPLLAAIFLVGLAGIALSILTDLIVTRPIQGREIGGHFGVVLGLTAAFFAIIQLTRQVFSARTYLGKPLVDGNFSLWGTNISWQSLLTVAAALGVSIALSTWHHRGRWGQLLSAVSDNWEAAVLLGLPIRGIRYFALGIAGLICALAGTLLAGSAPVTFHSGFGLALLGFVALVVGGQASSWGPLLGGTVIGLTETVGARFAGASIREYLLLLVILLVFKFRPHGLLARVVRD